MFMQIFKEISEASFFKSFESLCMLSSMVKARQIMCIIFQEANLADHPIQFTKEVEDYAENTHSSLLYLTLESLGQITLLV